VRESRSRLTGSVNAGRANDLKRLDSPQFLLVK
jgi:hypothetical protein